MTHNTEDLEPANLGNREGFLHTINITSLDAAGQENYDPDTEVNIPNGTALGVQPAGQDDTTFRFSWDHVNNHLDVINVSDGTNTANNFDCGEVRLLVVGGGT